MLLVPAAPAKRVMSLKEPRLKMSKSHADARSRILVTDAPDEIRQKIRLSLTDSIAGVSYDPAARPGVSNLIEILAHFERSGKSCEALAREHRSLSMRAFKERVADCIAGHLAGLRAEFGRVMALDGGRYIDSVAEHGARKARASAEATMDMVRKQVGLR